MSFLIHSLVPLTHFILYHFHSARLVRRADAGGSTEQTPTVPLSVGIERRFSFQHIKRKQLVIKQTHSSHPVSCC
jgi:hypothetical protein